MERWLSKYQGLVFLVAVIALALFVFVVFNQCTAPARAATGTAAQAASSSGGSI